MRPAISNVRCFRYKCMRDLWAFGPPSMEIGLVAPCGPWADSNSYILPWSLVIISLKERVSCMSGCQCSGLRNATGCQATTGNKHNLFCQIKVAVSSFFGQLGSRQLKPRALSGQACLHHVYPQYPLYIDTMVFIFSVLMDSDTNTIGNGFSTSSRHCTPP